MIKNAETAAVPTSSQVEYFSMGALDLRVSSNIEETIAFSAFSLDSLFHSKRVVSSWIGHNEQSNARLTGAKKLG